MLTERNYFIEACSR